MPARTGVAVGDGAGIGVALGALTLGAGDTIAIATARMIGVNMLLRSVGENYLDDLVADDDEFPVDPLFGAIADAFVSSGVDVTDVVGPPSHRHEMVERVAEPYAVWVGTVPVRVARSADQDDPYLLVIGDADDDVLHFGRPYRKLKAVRVRTAARMNAFAKQNA